MALLYAYLGDTDAAFNWLDRADAIGSLSVMPYDMYYSNLHDDPRWSALQARRGISLEQLDAIEFERLGRGAARLVERGNETFAGAHLFGLLSNL